MTCGQETSIDLAVDAVAAALTETGVDNCGMCVVEAMITDVVVGMKKLEFVSTDGW